MQHCDRGPVWCGTLGVGGKPPSTEGLLISLSRLLVDSTVWPDGRCKSGWVHVRVDLPPFMSSADPTRVHPWLGSLCDVWRSVMLLVIPHD
jgi:hypothetical protein